MSAKPPFIPVLRPLYGEEEKEAVCKVLERGWTGSGPEVEAFEAEFAAFLGVEAWQVVATSSCTAALHLALLLLELNSESRVGVPAITFASTALAVHHRGALVRYVDVAPETLCVDRCPPTRAKGLPEHAALLPVHLAGHPCDMWRIWGQAAGSRTAIIEDCAHAVGTRDEAGVHVGTSPRSLASCWSFHAVKNIGAGDGGAVLVHDPDHAARLRRLRWCGIDLDTHARTQAGAYRWAYEVIEVGYKYQMTELAAAVARAQLRRLPELNARRQEVADAYQGAFSTLDLVQSPQQTPHGETRSNHLFIIRVPRDRRVGLIEHLSGLGVGTSVHYKPLPQHRALECEFAEIDYALATWPLILSLPMHAALSDDDVDRVIDGVRSFFA